MLIAMDKSKHEEHFIKPVQTNIKQLTLTITFIAGLLEFLFLQTKIKNSISQNQFNMMISLKYLFHLVLMKKRA